MKYKLRGIAAVFAALAAALLVSVLSTTGSGRVHQHRDAAEKSPCGLSHSEGELCTHLPLVVIDTGGVEIPGKPLGESGRDEDGRVITYYSRAQDGSARITAEMTVIDGEGYNHVSDEGTVSSSISIRVRGRSSRYFAKSSYALTLLHEDGSNNAQALMGMDAHHDWALYGPYLDKTNLRNYMFYNISGELMDYAPNVRYCELVLNGEYQGLYVMTETITAGQNGARLPLEVSKRYQKYTGYAVRLDQNHDKSETINSFTGYTFRRETDLEIVYPGPANQTPQIVENITQDISDFEKMLYSYDYDDDDEGYAAHIDIDSFIDAFLINEITANYDFGGLSTYLYKGIDGKFRVCVWDFNNSCDNFDVPMGWRSIELEGIVWYTMLMKDEDFTKRTIDRYRVLRENQFSDAYLDSYIDSVVEYLGPAAARDRARWEQTYEEGYGMLEDDARNTETYEEAIDQLKTYLHRRLEWMDENIESLRQYSVESKVKKYTETPN